MACKRLKGTADEFEEALATIRQLADAKPEENRDLFQAAKVLCLNQQPKLALEILARNDAHVVARVEILVAQSRFAEALALVEKTKEACKKIKEEKVLVDQPCCNDIASASEKPSR